MKIWLITVGEPLPIESGQPRLLRTGILADLLARRGHQVTWWTSAFDHFRKRFHSPGNRAIEVRTGLSLRLLDGCGYRTNVSVARLVNHWQIARQFRLQARAEARPDLVLCSLPTIELCVEAVRYGQSESAPVVLDIRDFWPDVFSEVIPAPLRPLSRLALLPMVRAVDEACRGASAIIGITAPFVSWGLRHAGRAATEFDRDFPFGYVHEQPPTEAVDAARNGWHAWGVHDTAFIVCFFGTVGRHFDLETVIEAAGMLRSRCPDMKLVLCGDGDRLTHYQELAKAAPNVQFPGRIEFPSIWTLMRIASAGLAPYRNARNFALNIPNKIIEYLSAGLPIVSSLEGEVRTLLSQYNCGLTYESATGLVEALCRLYDDAPLRSTLAGNAKVVFREKFVADKVYGSLSEHLEALSARYHQ
ncbi:MAG TPA: glycosyltransferase family 4 protein [Burkholderiales bacterium]|nr:glycosyltransferase family 4 protein [Burkholderiales bacterium]